MAYIVMAYIVMALRDERGRQPVGPERIDDEELLERRERRLPLAW